MKCAWKNLPKPLNCFTVRNATIVDLDTGKIVNNYSANTKIVVVQKCVTKNGTYYRTSEAVHHHVNYAFKASDFGLPNEIAPSEHSLKTDSLGPSTNLTKPGRTAPTPAKKQKPSKKTATPKDGGEGRFRSWVKGVFRRRK